MDKNTSTTEYFNRFLPVKLTDMELLERGRTMSERHKERDGVVAEKKVKMQEYGETLKTLTGEITRLSEIISTGCEPRSVDCTRRKSWTDKKVYTVRIDTGEIIEVRAMFPEEMQEPLPLEDRSTKS